MKRFHPAWALFLLFLALFPLLPGCAAHPAPPESEGALFFFLGRIFPLRRRFFQRGGRAGTIPLYPRHPTERRAHRPGGHPAAV